MAESTGGRKGELGSLGQLREVTQQSSQLKGLGESIEKAESAKKVASVPSPVKTRSVLVMNDGKKDHDIPIEQEGDRAEGVSEIDKEMGELGTDNGLVTCQVLASIPLGDNRDQDQNEAEKEHKEQEVREGELEIEGLEGDIYVRGSVRPSLRELNIKVNVEGGNQHKDHEKLTKRTWKRLNKGVRNETAQPSVPNKDNVDDRGVKRGRESDLGEEMQEDEKFWGNSLKSIKVEAHRTSPKVGVASHNWTQGDK